MERASESPGLVFEPYPIPYPAFEKEKETTAVERQDKNARSGRDEDEQPSQTTTPRAKRFKAFTTPFRAPRPASSSTADATTRPKSIVTPSPASSTPKRTIVAPPKLPRKAFRPPSIAAPSLQKRALNPAVELSQLERRVQLLRQATKYKRADLMGGKDGETELKALCERWKEAGRAAADLLWTLTGGAQPDTLAPTSSQHTGGFESSWGFSSPATSLDPFTSSSPFASGGFDSSWGFSSSSSSYGFSCYSESTEDFLVRVDQAAKEHGMTRKQIIDQIERDTEDLPTADQIIMEATRGLSNKKRVKIDEEEKDDDDDFELMLIGARKECSDNEQDEEEESVAEQEARLAALVEANAALRAEEDGDLLDKDEDDEAGGKEKAEDEWHVGMLMRTVGVDPSLFGWDEEAQDFA